MITIAGASGRIKDVDEFISHLLIFSEEEGVVIQALDATAVYGKEHLVSAASHAIRAFDQQTNAMNSLALEILLYAAGERQIHKALKKMGIKMGNQVIAFVLVDSLQKKLTKKRMESIIRRLLQMFQLSRDDKLLDGDRDTLKRLGITEKEIGAIPESKYGDLVLEKVAMVDVIK